MIQFLKTKLFSAYSRCLFPHLWYVVDYWLLGQQERSVLYLGGRRKSLMIAGFLQTGWKVSLVDPSPSILRKFKKKFSKSGNQVVLSVGGFSNLPYKDHEFSSVVCNFSLHYIKDKNKFLQELRRVLKPKGKAVLICAAPHSYWATSWFLDEFRSKSRYQSTAIDFDELIKLFANHDLSLSKIVQRGAGFPWIEKLSKLGWSGVKVFYIQG